MAPVRNPPPAVAAACEASTVMHQASGPYQTPEPGQEYKVAESEIFSGVPSERQRPSDLADLRQHRLSLTARRVLAAVQTGASVVCKRNGGGYAYDTTGLTAPKRAVEELVRRGILTTPGYPLFDRGAGGLTDDWRNTDG